MEFESASCCLLEELRKWMSTTREGTTLALHGVIRVVAIVVALSQLRVGQHFIRFIHNRHLSFTATLIWVCSECSLATAGQVNVVGEEANT
jgi:hypothetical protein